MNKLLSSIMLATLTVLTTIPFSMAPAAALTGAIISMDQPQYSGNIGDTFQVTITLTNQPMLVGYDFSLLYNNAVLSCVTYNDHGSGTLIGPFVASGQAFQFFSGCSDPEGVARSAFSLLGGVTTNVLSSTLAVITFQIIGDGNSDLIITHDQLVCATGDSTGPCAPHTDINSSFLVAPAVNLVPVLVDGSPVNAQPAGSPVRFLRKGQTTVVYNALIQLSPSNARAGYGAVFLTATDPNGGQLFAQSNIAFMFPGDSTTVSATIDFSSMPTIGTWSVTATVLECANPAICIPAASGPGLFFKVKS